MADDARISTALPQHPKTKKLRRRLGDGGCWSLVCLFLWTAANRWDGSLADMSDEDIELAADWIGEPGALVAALVDVGFLDGGPGDYAIHDWQDHNPWAASRGQRQEIARAAAAARWEKRAGRLRGDTESINKDAQRMHDACTEHAPSMHDACAKNETAMPTTQTPPNTTQPNPTEKAIAPSAPAKRASQLPPGFDLTEEMRQFAREQGVADPVTEFAAFCDYHSSKGSTFKDWTAAWRTWARNASKFGQRGKGKAPPAGYLGETHDDLLAALQRQSGEVQ